MSRNWHLWSHLTFVSVVFVFASGIVRLLALICNIEIG